MRPESRGSARRTAAPASGGSSARAPRRRRFAGGCAGAANPAAALGHQCNQFRRDLGRLDARQPHAKIAREVGDAAEEGGQRKRRERGEGRRGKGKSGVNSSFIIPFQVVVSLLSPFPSLLPLLLALLLRSFPDECPSAQSRGAVVHQPADLFEDFFRRPAG